MNRTINIFSGITLLLLFALLSAVIYDFSISNISLRGLPLKFEVFTGISFVIFLLGLVRAKRRWQGVRDMKNYKNFVYSKQASPKSLKFASLFSILEIVGMLCGLIYAYGLYQVSPDYVLPIIIVLGVLVLESIIFFMKLSAKGDSFKYGIDDEVLAYFVREMNLIYYKGLLKVELYQKDMINFQYKNDLNIIFPTNVIEKADRPEFRDNLIKILEDKNVYIDDAFRTWE